MLSPESARRASLYVGHWYCSFSEMLFPFTGITFSRPTTSWDLFAVVFVCTKVLCTKPLTSAHQENVVGRVGKSNLHDNGIRVCCAHCRRGSSGWRSTRGRGRVRISCRRKPAPTATPRGSCGTSRWKTAGLWRSPPWCARHTTATSSPPPKASYCIVLHWMHFVWCTVGDGL